MPTDWMAQANSQMKAERDQSAALDKSEDAESLAADDLKQAPADKTQTQPGMQPGMQPPPTGTHPYRAPGAAEGVTPVTTIPATGPAATARTDQAVRQANAAGHPRIASGMQIFGCDGQPVGYVKDVRADAVLVDRPMERDVYLPRSALQMSGGRLTVDVPADQVGNQGWRQPPVI